MRVRDPQRRRGPRETIQGPDQGRIEAQPQTHSKVENDSVQHNAQAGDTSDMRANDPACLLCDDGGNVMSCDGHCMRSFHVGMVDADAYLPEACNPMEMPEDLAKCLNESKDPFLCPSCLSHWHRCFKCGEEGSAKPDNGSTMKRCSIFECGRFYHPHCIGKAADDNSFICPLHICAAVAEGRCRNDDSEELLIECRRCPIAYHRDCLPLSLLAAQSGTAAKRVWLAKPGNLIDDDDESDDGFEYDPVDRSLIYCMKHIIEQGQDIPDHDQPLFSRTLMTSWALHYARVYPALKSSARLIATAPHRHCQSPEDIHCPRTRPDCVSEPRLSLQWDNTTQDPGIEWKREFHASLLKAITQGQELEASNILLQPHGTDPEPSSEAEDDSEGSLLDFEKDEYWSETFVLQRHAATSELCSRENTHDSVRQATRMPEPYTMPFRKTITQASPSSAMPCSFLSLHPQKYCRLLGVNGPQFYEVHISSHLTCMKERLQGILQAVNLARERPKEKHLYVTPKLLNEIRQQEDNLRTSLACYLHNDRYSSYGRHFTKIKQLKIAAKKLQVFINPDDTVVDFSCGSNDFLPMLKLYCLRYGKKIKGRAFDIITAACAEDFQQISWFDVRHEHLGICGDNLIIGLNPPYGMNNSLAAKFQEHALQFHPRIIVLIVPPATPIPHGYVVLLDDRQTMADKSFYIPGLTEDKQDQWNKITPSLRIMARQDCYPLSDRLHAQHMGPVARAYTFPVVPAPVYFGIPPIAPIMPMGQIAHYYRY